MHSLIVQICSKYNLPEDFVASVAVFFGGYAQHGVAQPGVGHRATSGLLELSLHLI